MSGHKPVMIRKFVHDEDVHVWTTTLQVPSVSFDACWRLLSFDERRRADAFSFSKHRRRYVVAHGLLRRLLGRYIGHPPHALNFQAERYGKPRLVTGTTIEFNLSHSHEHASIAVATRPVGVDMEFARPLHNAGALATRLFSPSEAEALEAGGPENFIDRFYACWTRKEAYVKARGEGLSKALDSFAVSVIPGDPRLIHDLTDPEAHRWSFRHLQFDSYIGAVVALGPVRRLTRVRWHESGVHW